MRTSRFRGKWNVSIATGFFCPIIGEAPVCGGCMLLRTEPIHPNCSNGKKDKQRKPDEIDTKKPEEFPRDPEEFPYENENDKNDGSVKRGR